MFTLKTTDGYVIGTLQELRVLVECGAVPVADPHNPPGFPGSNRSVQ